MAGIGYASVRPFTAGTAIAQSDKLAHALAYGLLALALARALAGGAGLKLGEAAFIACIWATAYGGIAEIVQHFVGRHADLFDVLANAGGAALAACSWLLAAAWLAARGGS